MSYSRLALRLAAIEALAPCAKLEAGPWPTIAGPRVYDSRIDPVATAATEVEWETALAALENKPLISVYTEDDHTLPQGSEKVWPNQQTCTLTLELMIAARRSVMIPITNPDGTAGECEVGELVAPITDRKHEALLDIMEGQALALLNLRGAAPSAALFRHVVMECSQYTSDPQRAVDKTARLAMRTIKLHLRIRTEDWRQTTPAAPLPAPLSFVADALPAGSSGSEVCALAAAALAAPAPPATPAVKIAINAATVALPTHPDGSDSTIRGSVGGPFQE